MTTARHSDTENSPDHLQRKLSNRHLQLIAIGVQLEPAYLWVRQTISLAGPSILLIYMIIGGMFLFLNACNGELLLANLHYKSFVDMAHDLIGPWAGYYWVGLIGWAGCWSVLRIFQQSLTI